MFTFIYLLILDFCFPFSKDSRKEVLDLEKFISNFSIADPVGLGRRNLGTKQLSSLSPYKLCPGTQQPLLCPPARPCFSPRHCMAFRGCLFPPDLYPHKAQNGGKKTPWLVCLTEPKLSFQSSFLSSPLFGAKI